MGGALAQATTAPGYATLAAGAATLTWVVVSYLRTGKTSVVGAAAGAVAGLVAVTPASGFVTAGGQYKAWLVHKMGDRWIWQTELKTFRP